jgi:site-specific DNA-cytosine methylase
MDFAGDLTSKYKQIGNAVPVALAEHVACAVRAIIEKTK